MYYNDENNDKAALVMFKIFQMLMTFIVYGFIYTSFLGVQMTIEKKGLTFMTYLPEVIAVIVYTVLIYKTTKMFKNKKRLLAIGWLMGWASVIIVFLYTHLSQLVS